MVSTNLWRICPKSEEIHEENKRRERTSVGCQVSLSSTGSQWDEICESTISLTFHNELLAVLCWIMLLSTLGSFHLKQTLFKISARSMMIPIIWDVFHHLWSGPGHNFGNSWLLSNWANKILLLRNGLGIYSSPFFFLNDQQMVKWVTPSLDMRVNKNQNRNSISRN